MSDREAIRDNVRAQTERELAQRLAALAMPSDQRLWARGVALDAAVRYLRPSDLSDPVPLAERFEEWLMRSAAKS